MLKLHIIKVKEKWLQKGFTEEKDVFFFELQREDRVS